MYKTLALAILLLPTLTIAQEAKPAPAPAPAPLTTPQIVAEGNSSTRLLRFQRRRFLRRRRRDFIGCRSTQQSPGPTLRASLNGFPIDLHHAPLYAVLMASSSAALILPVVDSLGLGGEQVLRLLPQIAVADAACIVALPLVIDPAHAGRAALGAAAVILAAALAFLVLRHLERSGVRRRVHELSEDRRSRSSCACS